MVLNPSEIYDKDFKKQIKIFGYKPEDVDDYLDVIATYYDELWSERNKLKEKVVELEKELEHYKNMEDSLERTIKVGQETMEHKKENAKQQANVIIKEAETKAENIIAQAKQKKDKILAEAQDEVEKKYKNFQEVAEKEKLFKIRFKTLLESHLEMLDTDEEDLERLKKKIKNIKAED